MNKKILVLPDIHGRNFWEKPCENIDEYDKVIFLGDYLDPYDFEGISVETAIDNFKKIIDFKKKNNDKVVLLIGNHDCPYAYEDYYKLSYYHCRHSNLYHNVIRNLFVENKELFKICHIEDDIIFTHAGIESGWLEVVAGYDYKDDISLCEFLNNLVNTKKGLCALHSITSARGGRNKYGSCIWADVHDIECDIKYNESFLKDKKQIFGHTLQAYYGLNREIMYGNAIQFDNCKMLDNCKAYVLNCESFEVKSL